MTVHQMDARRDIMQFHTLLVWTPLNHISTVQHFSRSCQQCERMKALIEPNLKFPIAICDDCYNVCWATDAHAHESKVRNINDVSHGNGMFEVY